MFWISSTSRFNHYRERDVGVTCSQTKVIILCLQVFTNNATHVVCRKLTRSEKFLGAVALGNDLEIL